MWCETYWLPETDLIDLRSGVALEARVGPCRPICSTTAGVDRWGGLGPNSVILPAATIGRHGAMGPVSWLEMRGESVPDATRDRRGRQFPRPDDHPGRPQHM